MEEYTILQEEVEFANKWRKQGVFADLLRLAKHSRETPQRKDLFNECNIYKKSDPDDVKEFKKASISDAFFWGWGTN